MKNTLAIIGLILIIVNLAAALIISDYSWVNAFASCLVIILNLVFVNWINSSGLKDGFRISLCVLIPIIGIIEFFCAACSISQVEDNYGFVAALVLIVFQLITIIICNKVSKSV